MTDELTFTRQNIEFGDEPRIEWILKGERGAIRFCASPCSEISHKINLDYPAVSQFDNTGWSWTGWDLGAHSHTPLYEDQELSQDGDTCPFIDAPCYYDGTSLGASELLGTWLRSGQNDLVIEQVLHERYQDWLCSDEDIAVSPITALIEVINRVGQAEAVEAAEQIVRNES